MQLQPRSISQLGVWRNTGTPPSQHPSIPNPCREGFRHTPRLQHPVVSCVQCCDTAQHAGPSLSTSQSSTRPDTGRALDNIAQGVTRDVRSVLRVAARGIHGYTVYNKAGMRGRRQPRLPSVNLRTGGRMGAHWTAHWTWACTPCVDGYAGAFVRGAVSHQVLHYTSRTNRARSCDGKRRKGTQARLQIALHPDTCLEGGLRVLACWRAVARVRYGACIALHCIKRGQNSRSAYRTAARPVPSWLVNANAQCAVSGAASLPRPIHALLELYHVSAHVKQERARLVRRHSGTSWVGSILAHATRFVVGRRVCALYGRSARAAPHCECTRHAYTFVRAWQRHQCTAPPAIGPGATTWPVWSHFGVVCRLHARRPLTPDARIAYTITNSIQSRGERVGVGGRAPARAGARCFVLPVWASTAEGSPFFGRFGSQHVSWDIYRASKGGAWIYICGAGVRPIQCL